MTPQIEMLNKAAELAGGVIPLAKSVGVSHQAIYQWKKRGYVPAESALIIEHKFGIPHGGMVRSALADIISLI